MTKTLQLALTIALLVPQLPEHATRDAAHLNGIVETRWPGGALRTSAQYREGVYDGFVRGWYQSGRPWELRHYARGHEDGRQQAWTEAGELYINYEARDGRRFGLLNSTPCVTVGPAGVATPADGDTRDASGLPFYDTPDFTPHWTASGHRVGAFALQTQTGAAVSEAGLAGRIHVASFVYTKCSAVCPILIAQLQRVQTAARAMPNVTLVSYTVTPEDDTPARLAAFGRERDIDPVRWWLVTGERAQIYALARSSYFADDGRAGRDDTDAEALLHTEKVLLVDGRRRLRGIYNGTQPREIDLLIGDLARLAGQPAKYYDDVERRTR